MAGRETPSWHQAFFPGSGPDSIISITAAPETVSLQQERLIMVVDSVMDSRCISWWQTLSWDGGVGETRTGWERSGTGWERRPVDSEARARGEEQARSEVRARSEAALSAWREESSRALRASRAVDTSGRDEARRAFPAR